MRDPPERPVVAVLPRPRLHVAGMDDQARGSVEHLPRERELLRPHLPQRRHAPLEHAVAEQATGHARLPLQRGEVGVAVLAADGQAGDEMVEHELVQHDDARPPPQRVDDPAVGVRVVADVVERDVGIRHRPGAPRPHDLDLDEPLERREKES